MAESGGLDPQCLRTQPASNGCRPPGRFTFQIWRMTGALEAQTLSGPIGFQNRAGAPVRFVIHGPPDRSRTCAGPAFGGQRSSTELREDGLFFFEPQTMQRPPR